MRYHHIQIIANHKEKPKASYIGTAMRGTFGDFLKEYVCTEPHYNCNICTHTNTCLSYKLFPTKDDSAFSYYRLDARLDPETYDFSLYLFDDFTLEMRPILQSLYRMLRSSHMIDDGTSVRFLDATISLNGEKMLFKRGLLQPFSLHATSLIPPKKSKKLLTLTLLTPFFIKEDGKLHENPSLEDILFHIQKRKDFFEHKVVSETLRFKPSYTLIEPPVLTRYKPIHRYSNKQKKHIPFMDGMVGEFYIKDLDVESYALLKWGEILGAGKKVSLGQGALKID